VSYASLGREGCPTGYEPSPGGCERIPEDPPPPDFPVPEDVKGKVVTGLLLLGAIVVLGVLLRD